MDRETFREYCLSKRAVTESLPFGEDVLVYKVLDKVFALTNLKEIEFKVNLKCEPERAIELRERFEEIKSGFHMNKKHWNTINFEGGLSEKLLEELITLSYNLVAKGFTKKEKLRWSQFK